MNGGQLINQSALSKLIEKRATSKAAAALHEVLVKFRKSETFSGYEVRRTIRLEINRYKSHSS